MNQDKYIKMNLYITLLMIFFVPIIMPEPLFATDPIDLKDNALNGQYIGKHIEYLSHKDLIDSLINELDLDDAFKEKIRSGDLVSDDVVTVDLKWTTTGYSAYFEYVDGKAAGQLFEVGVNDLLRPEISSKFVPSQERIVKLRFSPRPYWLRFGVLNEGDGPIDFLLELNKHLFEYINIYIPKGDGVCMKRAALATPLDQREIQYRNFVFKLSAGKGQTTYYLLVNSWNRLNKDSVPLRIWSPENFIRHTSDEGLYRGIIVGLFLFIFFYNIFIYISVKDPAYVYLSLVTLCQMILEMSVSGLGFKYLWPNHPLFVTQALFQTTALVMGFNLLFYRSFIGISRYTPKLDRALLFMSWSFFGSALSFFILPQPMLEYAIASLFTVDHLYSLPILIPTIIAVREKNPSGWFALIGILFYYLGLLKFGLTSSDMIPYGPLHYLPIKGLSFLIIMTLGLAYKLNMMKKSLVDLNVNLERRVIERTEELKEANEKLKEMDKLKTRFFTNISHEFRTPLTLITAPIESLLGGDYGKLPKRSIDIMVSMKRNADRLLKLISDLLDFSKIEAGKMDANMVGCNVSELLSVWIAGVDSSAASRGIKIAFQDKTDGLQALIDPDLMEKAVLNLLSNAIKFNRPEGENLIEVILENDAASFRIIVEDSGIGIPDDQLDGIFDRFSQVDSSSTRRYEGSGIGLSLTKEIVQLHNGAISVESKVGEGSAFTISIPLVSLEDAQSGRLYSDDSSETSTAGKRDDVYPADIPTEEYSKKVEVEDKKTEPEAPTILIVEDNDDMRDYLARILSKNYRTLSAVNGREALLELEKKNVDLVLSDLMMPEMGGYELTQSIRSNGQYEGLPIILLTAKSQVADKIQGFEKGANDYIIKPFSAEEVLARIKSQLKFKLLRDKLLRANLNLKGRRKILTDTSKVKVEVVKEFLDENYDEDISREDLAAEAGMSPDHLGKMFKQYTGAKISDYINQRRVEDAARQLQGTRSKIIDIAFDVGFGSLRSFNQVFRDLMGDSPSNYRKKHKRNRDD
jgi:signal transduction histidine kinase/CheY-like chemotaxis protein/AraC-like DNA-binding protein